MDAIGRPWQLSTVQFDLNLAERFKLEYVAEDGTRKQPLMVHRALFGSVERFFGVLIEHYAGAFPVLALADSSRHCSHQRQTQRIRKESHPDSCRQPVCVCVWTIGRKR